MERYGTMKACPKCGNHEFKDEWSGNSVVTGGVVLKQMNGEESIVRACTNCGYTFQEYPLDSKTIKRGTDK